MVSRASAVLPLATLALMASLAGTAPARAQSDTISSVMSMLGLKDDDKPEIEYRERAPLVVPPKMDLRPPQQSPARANAAWPTDPDVVKKRKEAAQAKVPRTETLTYKLNEGKALSVDEMRGGRVAGAGLNTGPANPYQDELRREFWTGGPVGGNAKPNPEANLLAAQEPDRRFLTDPPTGYRAPSDKASRKLPGRGIEPKVSDNEEASPWTFNKQRQ